MRLDRRVAWIAVLLGALSAPPPVTAPVAAVAAHRAAPAPIVPFVPRVIFSAPEAEELDEAEANEIVEVEDLTTISMDSWDVVEDGTFAFSFLDGDGLSSRLAITLAGMQITRINGIELTLDAYDEVRRAAREGVTRYDAQALVTVDGTPYLLQLYDASFPVKGEGGDGSDLLQAVARDPSMLDTLALDIAETSDGEWELHPLISN